MMDPEMDGSLTGRVLADRYRMLGLIGRGGMGAVYRAADSRLEREVAVKVVSLAGASAQTEERLRARFRREARAAARLQHPNVVAVHDFGTDEALGIDFLVMELLQGRDFSASLDHAPPPVPEAVEILTGVLRGVAAGHRAGLVHRDIKPANLFLADGDEAASLRVRVLDFGIAQLYVDEATRTHLTQVGHAPLSPAYASPEQLRGVAELTPASDVFSLGATAFQLLTGERAFSPAERIELAGGHAVEPRSARSLNPAIPTSLDLLVRRSLAMDPGKRFADAGEFLRALAAAAPAPVVSPILAGIEFGDPPPDAPPLGHLEEDRAPGEMIEDWTSTRSAGTIFGPPDATVLGPLPRLDPGGLPSLSLAQLRARRIPAWRRGGVRLAVAGLLALPLIGWGTARSLEAYGWGVAQTGAEAFEQCTRRYQARNMGSPGWGAIARACGRAFASGELGDAERITALRRRIEALRAMDQRSEVERAARELVRLAPGEESSHLGLGEALYGLERYEEALWAYRRALELWPGGAVAHLRAGQALRAMGRGGDALGEYQQAVRLDAGHANSWQIQHEMAGLLFELERWDESLRAHRRVTELRPDWADGWGNWGLAAHLLGRHGEAVSAYERALQVDSRFFDTRPDQRRRWQESLRNVI